MLPRCIGIRTAECVMDGVESVDRLKYQDEEGGGGGSSQHAAMVETVLSKRCKTNVVSVDGACEQS
jgi:hypothetical protein